MRIISTIGKFLDALITAILVVLDLIPDPTRRPVPVPVERSDPRR